MNNIKYEYLHVSAKHAFDTDILSVRPHSLLSANTINVTIYFYNKFPS